MLASLGREHQRLTTVVALAKRLDKLDDELAQARELVVVDDAELAAEARSEVTRVEAAIGNIEHDLKPALVPPDPLNDRPAIVEIRPGTGGDEAALFAADLYRMYTRFLDRRGWKYETLQYSDGTLGGLKEAVFKVTGDGAVGAQRLE